MAAKFQFTKEQRDKILNGSIIDAIKTIREITYLGLVEAKKAIDAIRAGRMPLDDFFEPKEKCPHCDGTGFVQPPEEEQPNVV